jgi:hypothetical protein
MDCRFFGGRNSWITDGDFHYKCPMCLRHYREWKDSQEQMHANKVVVLDVNNNAKLANYLQCGKRDFLFFYVRSGDSLSDPAALLGRLLQIENNLDGDLRDLPEDALYERVISLIQDCCQRSIFQHTELHPFVTDEIKRLNSSSAKQWQWQHLERGFNRATAPWVEESTRVLSIEELLTIRAHFNYLVTRQT